MRRRMILVVDDDLVVRESVSEGLRRASFEVLEAADAEEAMTLLEGIDNIELVFSDISMPGIMNGVGLASWTVTQYPSIKVLLTSGAGKPEGHRSELPFCQNRIAFGNW